MEHLKFKVAKINWKIASLLFSVKDGIEGYDKTTLTHTQTMEKNILPTMEVIAMEKTQ